ncbi:helix-turn-helix domain-containing protein [Streptomyces sp. NPDC005227]|uniref:helix-turn-helix domain-containing protein n=1 Tax=unclassified Streptomyces TaxID=2593676 RepID=UPI00367E7523
MTDRSFPTTESPVTDLGHNIRAARKAQGMSLRELARRAGISASALSQIETGKTRASAKTAYELAQHLGVTLAELSTGVPAQPNGTGAPSSVPNHASPEADGLAAHLSHAVEFLPREVQRTVSLNGGESFRVLSGASLPGANCLLLTYEPGASSPPNDEFVRHVGHEFNYLVSGRLIIEVGTERHELAPGDTLTFPATTPHRLTNPWHEKAELISLFLQTTPHNGH